jgi:hypothetical protein
MQQQASGFRPRDNPFPSRFELNASAISIQADMSGLLRPGEMMTNMRWRGAAHAVGEDFRRRFAAGEVELEGLQIKPRLESSRTRIPPAWSGLLAFDWTMSTVRVQCTVYVDVTGRRRISQVSAVAPPEHALKHQPRPPARRGRPPFPMEAMVEIAAGRLQGRKSNKEEAEILRRLFKETSPDKRAPEHSTIAKHLPEIYCRAAKADRALKGRK